MENCFNITDIYYKDIEEYKIDINNTIEYMISKNERLVFAVVAEKSGVSRFVVRQYPELRNYILQRMIYYKEIQVINKKINRAVNSLLKSNKSLTFISIINKCRFTSDAIYQNQYIKNKIRSLLIENKQTKIISPYIKQSTPLV
jgi:hypothetical protein